MSNAVRTTLAVFAVLSAVLTAVLLVFSRQIIQVLKVPEEAVPAAEAYMRICFTGVVFITAYNVVSAIFRGLGDTRRPMYYVAAAGIINVGLDWLLVGPFGMGAAGAAAATVASQGISVVIGLAALKKTHGEVLGKSGRINGEAAGKILGTGVPIALQEGLIQVSFLVITMIANSRGVEVSAAVGIVEKVISFLFLVPGAMLSTVSALSAQNAGAGRHERSRAVLRYGCMICACFGTVIFVLCQPLAPRIVSLFVRQGIISIRWSAWEASICAPIRWTASSQVFTSASAAFSAHMENPATLFAQYYFHPHAADPRSGPRPCTSPPPSIPWDWRPSRLPSVCSDLYRSLPIGRNMEPDVNGIFRGKILLVHDIL